METCKNNNLEVSNLQEYCKEVKTMSRKKYYPVSTMEFQGWITASGFKDPEEMHTILSRADERFLRYTIYPMFYRPNHEDKYNSEFCFPLVNKTYSTKTCPKFVIDTDYFTIIFLLHNDWFEGEDAWEVSVHIKDHEFCDIPIQDFKDWYRRHYNRIFCEMNEMPKRFVFPCLDLYSRDAEDFCIEFWNDGMDFMLFKLFDLLRIY